MDPSLLPLYILFAVIVVLGLAISFGGWYLFSRLVNGGKPVFKKEKQPFE